VAFLWAVLVDGSNPLVGIVLGAELRLTISYRPGPCHRESSGGRGGGSAEKCSRAAIAQPLADECWKRADALNAKEIHAYSSTRDYSCPVGRSYRETASSDLAWSVARARSGALGLADAEMRFTA
jgi:hypothetical protein